MATRKRPGRPALDPQDDQPSVNVHVRLAARAYDRTYQAASAARVSVPEYIRRQLAPPPARDRKE